jgi:hypothetical protein
LNIEPLATPAAPEWPEVRSLIADIRLAADAIERSTFFERLDALLKRQDPVGHEG